MDIVFGFSLISLPRKRIIVSYSYPHLDSLAARRGCLVQKGNAEGESPTLTAHGGGLRAGFKKGLDDLNIKYLDSQEQLGQLSSSDFAK